MTPQPVWTTVWDAYDVPRLWDTVRWEDDPLGWERVCGISRAAELLAAHAERLRARRETIAGSWHGPAATHALSRLDGVIAAIDGEAATLTLAARSLHGIMTALAVARRKIQPLPGRWEQVTSDWIPEFWDEVAAELNEEARTAMLVAAAEIRDHRGRIGPDPETVAAVAVDPPPSVPGYSPTTLDSPRIAGMPTPVPATAGQPVSMLPIPPGNPYAPGGGAYLLPGPGVGGQGFIVTMAAAPGVPAKNSFWKVPAGVPPVILPISHSPAHPSPERIAAFQDWYARLATPWRLTSPRA